MSHASHRKGTIARTSKETQIELALNLDAAQDVQLNTNVPFLTHMLNTIACHGRFGLQVKAVGDVEVDPHHLIEDCGLVLGQALAQALGNYGGIARAGCFAFPMDGTLALVSLDLCGRSNLTWGVDLAGQPIGTLDAGLFREFFKGWCDGAKATLHVHVPCLDNPHHGVEAIFKAFARALHQAVMQLDASIILSTKGSFDL